MSHVCTREKNQSLHSQVQVAGIRDFSLGNLAGNVFGETGGQMSIKTR